ncbi:hypothetical protein MPL3356_490049 [Mesorhizobium plurifarium]|uniref:Transposase n=1 Tax=Mesorhizobium plurifarium TaxID=69974 RepID=A0A090E5Y0_MESPL|nr:hypothetical protein MPL3356_490049 [Mesorhizobium plurifarium]
MRVEILGAERRRRWGDKKKLDIVMSVGIDEATVTEVAERHDVTRQQIYTLAARVEEEGALVAVGESHVPSRGHSGGAERTPYGQRHRQIVSTGRIAAMLWAEPAL